ncbi:MAG: hypothetical protein JWP31_641 [Aeromicrobium sp.]|nr:hypothetical protein [Aeromicrobium sp.]
MRPVEQSTPGSGVRNSRGTWVDHGVLAAALAVSLVGFRTIVSGNDWWITTLLVASLTGLTCAVARAVGIRWVAPVALGVEALVLAWIFVPETLASVVPTLATVRGIADLVSAAQTIIIEEPAPVGAAEPIVLVVAGAFGLIVIAGDALLQTRWAVSLVGLLLLAVFATPALISGETPPVWLFVAVAALWLVLLSSRSAGSGVVMNGSAPALVLGSAALAAAVAFPLVTPDISAVASSWGKPPPSVFGRGINPMLELGQNLRRNSTQTALTYTTTLDDPPYLKVATLRDFAGKTWRPAEDVRVVIDEVQVSADIATERASTSITIEKLRSSMLPVPYPAFREVSGLKGSWRWRAAGMTLSSGDDDSRGQTYTVASLDRQPTAEQMRGLDTFVGPLLGDYVKLPADLPPIIERTAREVTAGADNDYDRARALQAFFRGGDFRYSETAPVAEGYDGNGVDVIAKFLDVRAGYCVHFSSSMAVMARSLNMPARIAVGYAPGSPAGTKGGRTVYEVTSDNLHAWTEIYFQGVGWVQFDPTTGTGSATAFEEPRTDVDDTPDSAAPESDASTPQRGAERLDDRTATAPKASDTAPRTAIVTVGVLLLIGGLPWLLRAARRRWRLAEGRSSVDPLWRELEDTARDLGIAMSAADTPRGFADRLRACSGIDHIALDGLLRRVETARFARPSVRDGDGVADLQAVTTSLRAGAPPRQRLRATLLPRSLAGRPAVATDLTPSRA